MSIIKDQLEEVNAAITKILKGGQSYKIGSMSLERANLTKLYQIKKELEAQMAEENSAPFGRSTAAVSFDRR